MAKKSAIENNLRKQRLAKKYAARRKRLLRRRVRTIAYQRIAWLDIRYGEYAARCGCQRSFRTSPEGVLPKAAYDNQVRQAVLDRLLEDGLNVERTRQALARDFLLELSTGFVYDCLRWRVAQLDLAEHRQAVLGRFSGTLCIDELHLGRHTLLLAYGQFLRFRIQIIAEPHEIDHLLDPLIALNFRGSLSPEAKFDIFNNGHMRSEC